ncbi:response regulator [Stappia stellulata]|uniref:response regulator n=1 Tax=Stappia stellulata TaxID=71235 RepID=UPI001CD6E83A|nr:response regulator [Stappia stellulata]MCA1241599.1 response regulator [Stappia stellulata]|eukprot:jgi/Tetstr1/463752/TSEL_000801.t1
MHIDLSDVSILVIDDNSHMRSLFRAILNGFGARKIFEAGDGSDGLAVVVDRKPDVVICDWVMAPLSGGEFLSILRGDSDEFVATTPVIMVSADARKPVILRALELGIHEFLAKPVSPAMLYQRLYRVLTEHRPFVRKGSYFGPVPRSSMPPPAAAAPSGPAQQDMVFL